MITHEYKTKGVCSRAIYVELDDAGKTVLSVSFKGGCIGNLNAIAKLVAGMPVEQVVSLLKGNPCGSRPTSCADQMTIALTEAAAKAQA